ncbi:MAG: hypothetical protein WD770_01845 [Actinomycetota bacterium]
MARRLLGHALAAMNRLDERVFARIDRSWMGWLARRIEVMLARPYPPLSALSPQARRHVSWVLTGSVALGEPALMPYLRGRVRVYRRGILWVAVPVGLSMAGLSAFLKIASGGWVWGSLIWLLVPVFQAWLFYARARRAVQAQAEAFEGLEIETPAG